MAAWHQTIVVGNLGRDVEMRHMANGDAVASFSVAVTEKWKKDGEAHEATTWYRVSAFDRLAEICGQYLKKGSPVMVVGRMSARKYTKDGVEREIWELRADSMQMLGGKADHGHESGAERAERKAGVPGGQKKRTPAQTFDDDLDSIPF